MSTSAESTFEAIAEMSEGAPAPVGEFPVDPEPNGEVAPPEELPPKGEVAPPEEPELPGVVGVGLDALFVVPCTGHTAWPSPAPARTATATATVAMTRPVRFFEDGTRGTGSTYPVAGHPLSGGVVPPGPPGHPLPRGSPVGA